MSIRKHFVTFYSPGTFFTEQSTKEIPSWDTAVAVNMSKHIFERYNAKPYAFRFKTMLTADPVPDGEGGFLKVEPKEVESSGLCFLGGTLRNFDEVEAANKKDEKILRSNMQCNEMWVIITNCNSWKFTGEFSEKDCIVDENGNIVQLGNDPKLIKYRKEKTKEKTKAGL